MTRANRSPLTVLSFVVAASLITLSAIGTAHAQGARTDARWDAWLGCWNPVLGPQMAEAAMLDQTGDPHVCVVPDGASSAVEIVTVANNQIASRERIDATGIRREVQRDGCTGWEQTEW